MPRKNRTISVAPMEGDQFYLVDSADDWTTIDPSEFWNDAGVTSKVGVAQHRIIAVSLLEPEGDVEVALSIGAKPPAKPSASRWDHAVEASIRTRSGVLAVVGGTDAEEHVALPGPGNYRARISFGGLATPERAKRAIRYRVDLWPGPLAAPEVILRWHEFQPPVFPEATPGRRTLFGVEAFQAALREMKLQYVTERKLDQQLNAGLFRAKDGSYWEQTTPPPSCLPVLTELTAAQATELYKLKKSRKR